MNKGFTLVEVLVAVTILSIGILAVSQMTVMGMKVNTVVNQRMYARVVMAQVFESLKNLPVDHIFLKDPEGGAGGNDLDVKDSLADHEQIINDSISHHIYIARWNVVDSMPEVIFKTIRIHIIWGPGPDALKKSINTDLIRRML